MKRIFVISWFFPPINSSEGLVTYKLLKSSEFKYTVFTQKDNVSWSFGNEESDLKSKNIETVFSKGNTLKDFKKEAFNYFCSNQERFSLVMTRSMPPESHEVGLLIKKKFKDLKWIASFGDPIGNNPFELYSGEQYNPYKTYFHIINKAFFRNFFSIKRLIKYVLWEVKRKRPFLKQMEKKRELEINTFKNADLIIFNNTYQQEYMLGNLKDSFGDKSFIFPHSYDRDLFPINNKVLKKIRFVFIGQTNHIRTMRNMLLAFEKLENRYNISKLISLDIYGNISQDELEIIQNKVLSKFIKYNKCIKYLDSLKEMSKSDWLINIDARLDHLLKDNIFFPSKLVDYMGAKKNILNISMVSGITVDIVHKYGGINSTHNIEDIYNILYLIIFNNLKCSINTDYAEEFMSMFVAKKFDEAIQGLNNRV